MFSVDAVLVRTTCGSGLLAAPEEWVFDLQFERDGQQVRWHNGRDAVIGTVAEDGRSFSLEVSAELELSDAGYGSCAVQRDDWAKGTLRTPHGDVDGFTGELGYRYTVVQGTNCQLLLGAPEGIPALPCKIVYEMRASPWP